MGKFNIFALALVSAAAAAGVAWADDANCPPPGSPDAKVVVFPNPHWLRSPSSDDMVNAYPPMALRLHKTDQTETDCTVADDGKLQSCKVLKDDKPGAGFDKASVKLSSAYRMAPLASLPEYTSLPDCARKSGPPHVVIPVTWNAGG
ncbi:MAG TPA: hypothetical protein VMU37_01480 [Caulobacteraceae bacterium]|nr:hypothetical protein [Caulobacteraceae bacterium]